MRGSGVNGHRGPPTEQPGDGSNRLSDSSHPQFGHLVRARNSANMNISRKIHPSAATARAGVCESIWDPRDQAPKVISSICSGNQINASTGAETSVTIQKPEGIQAARTLSRRHNQKGQGPREAECHRTSVDAIERCVACTRTRHGRFSRIINPPLTHRGHARDCSSLLLGFVRPHSHRRTLALYAEYSAPNRVERALSSGAI